MLPAVKEASIEAANFLVLVSIVSLFINDTHTNPLVSI